MPSAAALDPGLETRVDACSGVLAERLGLYFPPERRAELSRALGAAAGELGCADLRQCLARIADGPLGARELDVLARRLTVGETSFFRDAAAFEALRRHILPALAAARAGDADGRGLRIWSAGCSSGEEPYSVAIAVAEVLPAAARRNLGILATDVNPQALAAAREAVYSEWSFRGTAPELKARCFSATADGRYRLHGRYRAPVRLAALNLAGDDYPAPGNGTVAMDLVLCRNVLMYFRPDRAAVVVDRLARSLAEGGWLLVSPVETSIVAHAELRPHRFGELVAFRKEAAQPARARSAPSAAASRAQAHRPPAREAARPAPQPPTTGTAPMPTEALLSAARADADRGRLADALAWCDRALAAAPLEPRATRLRGTVLMELGETEAAAAAFRRTLYLDPGDPLAHLALGNLLAAQGRRGAAARHYRNACAALDEMPREAPLAEGDGLTAGTLRALIGAILEREEAP